MLDIDFKLGDHVVLIRNERYDCVMSGYVYEVIKVGEGYIDVRSILRGGEHCGLNSDKFMLVRSLENDFIETAAGIPKILEVSTPSVTINRKVFERRYTERMEFNVGDKVTFVNNSEGHVSSNYKTESDGVDECLIIHGSITWNNETAEVVGISNGFIIVNFVNEDNARHTQLGFWDHDLKLVEANSILKQKMTQKRIYRVLIVDKKSGKTNKDEVVVAETEQQAILKAFGVDSANSFISVKEEGNFEEEKPITAILVKEPKKE